MRIELSEEDIKLLLIELLKNDTSVQSILKEIVSNASKPPVKLKNSDTEKDHSKNDNTSDDTKQPLQVLENEKAELESIVELRKKVNQQQQEEISGLKTALAEQQQETEALTEAHSQLQQENTKLTATLSQLQQEHSEGQDMLNKLKQLLGISEKSNDKVSKQISSLKKDLEQEKNTQSSLRESLETCQAKIKTYERTFSEEIEAYEKFQGLSKKTRTSLKGIFKEDSMAGFIACGVQEKSIDSLWEYLKNEVMEDNNPDLENLGEVFDFLFSRFTLALPIYERQHVNNGDEFDARQHIKHSRCHNVSGRIQSVYLNGWINTKTNKTIKQSIVSI